MSDEVKTHPVQVKDRLQFRDVGGPCAPVAVTMRAYEVYKHCHGEQEALITGGCRGGFGAGELVAFLYAHSFPQTEWRARAQEAFTGMRL